jgi:hypothetical protein
VEGSVTVDGKPLEKGTINFSTKEQGGGPSATAEIVAGRYQADGVPRGKVLVFFVGTKDTGKQIPFMGKMVPEFVNVIPEKFRMGVDIDITEASMRKDFDMKSE